MWLARVLFWWFNSQFSIKISQSKYRFCKWTNRWHIHCGSFIQIMLITHFTLTLYFLFIFLLVSLIIFFPFHANIQVFNVCINQTHLLWNVWNQTGAVNKSNECILGMKMFTAKTFICIFHQNWLYVDCLFSVLSQVNSFNDIFFELLSFILFPVFFLTVTPLLLCVCVWKASAALLWINRLDWILQTASQYNSIWNCSQISVHHICNTT